MVDNNGNKEVVYLNIDSSYYFKESSDEETTIINYKTNLYDELHIYSENKTAKLNSIINKYFEKYFPEEKEKKIDFFLLSHNLSKYFCKKRDINKNTIERYINYFFFRRTEITYSNTFVIKNEGIEYIGLLLSYIYSKLDYYKIKSKEEIKEKMSIPNNKNINVLTDFYNNCIKNNLQPNESDKSKFWYENRKNYPLPPELLFLIYLFQKITIFDFNINFQNELYKDDHFKYLVLVLMNLDLFIVNLDYFKFNFIHEKFQKKKYSLYQKKVLNAIYPDSLKINLIKDNETLYSNKWNFNKNFNLDGIRNTELNDKRKKKRENQDYAYGDYTVIQRQMNSLFNGSSLQKDDSIKSKDFLNNSMIDNYKNVSDPYKMINMSVIAKPTLDKKKKNINKDIDYLMEELILKNHYCFEIIFILFYLTSSYKVNNIDLIINYSYTKEIVQYFKNIKIDLNKMIDKFHILDLYSESLTKIKSLNVEIDSFDLDTYNQLLYYILLNNNLKILKFSFFTSDINYFSYQLLYTYLNVLNHKYTIKDSENNEKKILDDYYSYFKNNLLYLFYLIKIKSLETLGLNFEIPFIVQKNTNYMIIILKFLINILIYLNDPKCVIKQLTLLSPSTILDGRMMENLDNIFKEMDCYKKNVYLIELNLQFILYKMPHITNIITYNLLSLRIGNLDIITFESLINYLNSYNFSRYSLLKHLTIKLINNINYLTPKLKVLFRNLFSIKLKNFKKLYLYTNIIIRNKKECEYLIKILSDNWISYYALIFNEKSQQFFKENVNNEKITFLVPHNLENELIGADKNNNKNISTNPHDTVYWYLKYLFNNRYYYISKNFNAHKYYIYNILKYLYFEKTITIFYDIKSSEAFNK